MRKNYVTYLLIPLMITLSFCSSNHLPEPTEIKISDFVYPLSIKKEKVKALDVDYMQLFSWVEDIDHLLLYSFNKREDAYEFLRLDSELNESGKFALKRGQGPQEILKPYFVGGTLEEIFIYDGTGRRLVFCDREFKDCKLTRKALHSEEFIGGFGYSGDSGYFLMADEDIERSSGNAFARFYLRNIKNGTGKEPSFHQINYKRIERTANGGITVWGGSPHHARLIDNFAFIINLKSYALYKYDLNGRLIKSVKIRFKRKTFSKAQNKKTIAARGESKYMKRTLYPGELWPACWILQMGKCLAVGRRENYEPNSEKWITADYFDLELNFMGKIRLPAFKNWNHPLSCTRVIDRCVVTRGEKLWICKEDEDTEEVLIEEWSLSHDK
jgi:hypothetical protein